MTKRETCERLLNIHDLLKVADPPRDDVLFEVDELLLNLAAPVEDELHLDDEPNLTYAFKGLLRHHIKTQGDMRTICDHCPMAECCDSSVHEVCLELQKEATK